MASITIDVSDDQMQKLQTLASSHGLSPEEFLYARLEQLLSLPESDPNYSDELNAYDYVAQKHKEALKKLSE